MKLIRTSKTLMFGLVMTLVILVVLLPISSQVAEQPGGAATFVGRTMVRSGSVAVKIDKKPVANAKPAVTTTAADRELLAQLVRAESGAEPYQGQVAVAHVVINRVKSSRFPNTISGVIYQTSQFEPVQNGTINQPATASARRAVNAALNGWDPSHGALYFWDPARVSNSYLWSRPVTTVIGGHRFTE